MTYPHVYVYIHVYVYTYTYVYRHVCMYDDSFYNICSVYPPVVCHSYGKSPSCLIGKSWKIMDMLHRDVKTRQCVFCKYIHICETCIRRSTDELGYSLEDVTLPAVH